MKIEATKKKAKTSRAKSKRPIMLALDLLGRRGTLRILWELRDGEAFTFRALAAAAELSPATLNARLHELREGSIVEQTEGYKLTRLGFELIASIAPLLAWSERWVRETGKKARET